MASERARVGYRQQLTSPGQIQHKMCESDTGDGFWGERSLGNKLTGAHMTKQKAAGEGEGGEAPICFCQPAIY